MLEREKSNSPISREHWEMGCVIVINTALQGGNLPLAREAAERLGYDLDVILNHNHHSGENPENSVDK